MVGEITREEFHRMYGGVVGENDFDKEITIAEMARRITSDFKLTDDAKRTVKQDK